MRLIDADALFEVIKKSMAENPHKEKTQRAMHIHEHKYFLTLLTTFPNIQPEERTDKRTETRACDLIRQQDAVELAMKYCPDDDGTVQCDGDIRELLDELENLPPAQPEQKWIPCSERLPENRVSVIVCFREWQQYAKRYVYSIVVGWYARKHSVHENVFSDWEADCEYDEIEDEYYIEEGWYEFTTQGNGDLMNWYINADVIAWMPLPEPYKEGDADVQ